MTAKAGSSAAPAARSVPGLGRAALGAWLRCPPAGGCRVQLGGHRVPAGSGHAVHRGEHKCCVVSVLRTEIVK